MKDIVKSMLEHPIASIIVIAAISKTVTKIVKLVDKVQGKRISVTVNAEGLKKTEETTEVK